MAIDLRSIVSGSSIRNRIKRIAVVSDWHSYWTKVKLISHFETLGVEVMDLGVGSDTDETDDATLARRAVESIKKQEVGCVILLDISGNGLQIYANKEHGIIAAHCHDTTSAMEAALVHHANMCDISSTLDEKLIIAICEEYLKYLET